MRKTNPTSHKPNPQTDHEPAVNERPNRAQLAKLMGVSLPTVDDWVRRGCPVAETGGKGRSYSFNLPAVIEWRVRQERKRQGLPAGGAVDLPPVKPMVNPLRMLCEMSVRGYFETAWSTPLIEGMIEDVQKVGADRKAAARAVGGFFYFQRQALEHWLVKDFCDADLGPFLDEWAKEIFPRLPFIQGPPAKVNLDEVPEAVAALFTELEGYGPVEPQARPDAG